MILSFHGMEFKLYHWDVLCMNVYFDCVFYFAFFQGYQCTVKQSWHSLYIYGILKQRYGPDWGIKIVVVNYLHLTVIASLLQLFQGTTYVYDSFFKPYVAKHETEIDRNLLELRTRAGDVAVLYWQKAASYGQTRIFDILQYVASQSTPRPRPAQVFFDKGNQCLTVLSSCLYHLTRILHRIIMLLTFPIKAK